MMDAGARENGSVAESPGGEPRRARAPRSQLAVLFGVAVFVLAADAISKVVVVAQLSGHPPIRLLGGLLTLRLIRNSGAAFSLGTSMTVVFTAIAVGVIIFILRTARRLRSLPWAITLGLLLGGATGNLADRIFRAPGADARLTWWTGSSCRTGRCSTWPIPPSSAAASLAVLLAVRGLRLDGTVEGQPARAARPVRPARPHQPGRPGRPAAPGRIARAAGCPGRLVSVTAAQDQRHVPVPDGLDGERLDAALARMFGLSRARAADLVADGQVLVAGQQPPNPTGSRRERGWT